ncbi:uncharacterized protein PHACADRAFT_102786 [Phanerochaete carnosa HHB-10118-sp]|uniref:Uncharacterized protein n=1 Tax=Phanerochaete carnosa (strain HHB-10118-sp) TaxID=650164 RepID=K5VXH3_PHACS|nr:uncharacterized protein PHACADRAFT_102786 [Phanerochaete carnosa HHB-10118-sp]EKM51515.1 hypothetical protein PHACADRAFT_102786 [Phanerochaete carnosa HHB-10118-sp]
MSLSSDKQPVLPRNALITPSVSPPPSLRLASPKLRRKSTSRPPPNKRARTSEPPSSPDPSGSHTPTDTSTTSPVVNPTRDEAWRASSQRLLSVWSQLAERYNVPLDQDDIVDLRTVKLVKDRGITRRLKKGYRIGYFGDPTPDDADASSEDDRDGEDEIDSLPRPEPKVPIKLEMEKTNRVLPPFTEMNPADADDLKAFLEEEEQRRAIGGVDDDPDEDEVAENVATDFEDFVELGTDEEDEHSDWVTERVVRVDSRRTPIRRTPAPRPYATAPNSWPSDVSVRSIATANTSATDTFAKSKYHRPDNTFSSIFTRHTFVAPKIIVTSATCSSAIFLSFPTQSQYFKYIRRGRGRYLRAPFVPFQDCYTTASVPKHTVANSTFIFSQQQHARA